MASVSGKVDGFNGRGLFGWARRAGDDSPLRVDIQLDGVFVARNVLADRDRSDLAKAGSGGNHGFVWELPFSARFGDRVTIGLFEAESGAFVAEREFRAPYGDTRWRGHIGDLTSRTITGWVKAYGASEPVVADVYLDDELIVSDLLCDRLVRDLAKDGASHGEYGFNVPVVGYRPEADSVRVSLRHSTSGAVMLSREVQASIFDDSYEGRIETPDSGTIRAWAVNENARGMIFDVELLLDGQTYVSAQNIFPRGDLKKAGRSNGQGGLRFPNPLGSLLADGDEHTFALRFPDHTVSESVAISAPPRRTQGRQGGVHTPSAGGVSIIVPIYNAPDDVEICIQRLLKYTPLETSIILIDDCSPDPRVSEILASYSRETRLTVLANPENLGFTRTVNRGIDIAGADDVVLLNSDARVTPGWLEGLLAASVSSPRIATVTPMSDRAGAFSAPRIGNDNSLPPGVDEIAYALAFRRRSVGVYPRVPTGNGFCMWVSRACIDTIGKLDEVAFPTGYGEENDFCMRAGRAGWVHVIDDRTYVFHDRSKSFGASKSDLLTAGRAVVDSRYPEYKQAIRVFRDSTDIALARNRAAVAMTDVEHDPAVVPRVLYVVSTATGGTPQTNADLMNALHDAVEPWLLRCDSRVITLSRVVDGVPHEVRSHVLHDLIEPIDHFSPEYDDVVESWLDEYAFDIVHIRHLLWHSLSLPKISKRVGARVVVSFHDFYVLSPNLKLIDDRGIYLGDDFTDAGSMYRDSGWPGDQYPTPSGDWLLWWRERFWRAIEMCDAFVTTSESARALILSHYPEMDAERFSVIEHGRDFGRFRFIAQRPILGEPLRILVPGGISAAKGREVLRSIADADPLQQVEWHILGKISPDFKTEGSRVVHHGSYERKDFGRLVEQIAPHAGVVLSIWDETYCHTLTEMWSVGLPVFVLDFPNVAQRVRRFNAGWVLDGTDATELLRQLTTTLFDHGARVAALRGVSEWQHGWGLAWTTVQMATRYLDVYRTVLARGETPAQVLRVGVLSPSSRDLTRAPASTYVRVWERTRNSISRTVDYVRVTPDSALASVKERLIDALIVQRTAVPPAAAEALLRALEAASVPLIMELDDDLTAVHPDTEGHAKILAHGPSLDALLRRAIALSVSTEALRERFSDLDAQVGVFPASLSDRLWSAPPAARLADGKIRAVYFGTPTHARDLETVLPALDAIAALHSDFELSVIGVAPGARLERIRSERPWMSSVDVPESAKEYPRFVEFLRAGSAGYDFAIAPLEETELNAHKSDLKLLEYLGLGLRTVASAVGPYRDTSMPGIVVVPNTSERWIGALNGTIADVRAHGSRIDEREWLVEHRMLSHQRERFDALVSSVAHAQSRKTGPKPSHG